jgi:hypothetical protein
VSRHRFVPALLATLAALLIAVLCPLVPARAGDGGVADAFRQALRSAFGGTISATAATDGQVLTWTAATRTWGPGTVSGGGETLAQTLALGADGNAVNQTNLGSLALASGKTIGVSGYYGLTGYFNLSKNADQSFTSSGETVTWTTETTDQPGGVDVAGANTRIFTAPAAGMALVRIKVRAAVDSDPFDAIVKRFNVSSVEQTAPGDRDDEWRLSDATNALTVSTVVLRHMEAGDFLTLQIFTTGTIDLDDGGSNTTRAAVAVGTFVRD